MSSWEWPQQLQATLKVTLERYSAPHTLQLLHSHSTFMSCWAPQSSTAPMFRRLRLSILDNGFLFCFLTVGLPSEHLAQAADDSDELASSDLSPVGSNQTMWFAAMYSAALSKVTDTLAAASIGCNGHCERSPVASCKPSARRHLFTRFAGRTATRMMAIIMNVARQPSIVNIKLLSTEKRLELSTCSTTILNITSVLITFISIAQTWVRPNDDLNRNVAYFVSSVKSSPSVGQKASAIDLASPAASLSIKV